MANSHRQDVIANNLANAETTGFKRDLPLFQERLTEAQARRALQGWTNDLYEPLGGGLLVSPTVIDQSASDLEETGRDLDVGINGPGFFAIKEGGETLLTRDGRFITDRQGNLVTAGSNPRPVLDVNGNPIRLEPNVPVRVARDGRIEQNGDTVAQLGLFDVEDRRQLVKQGELAFRPMNGVALRPVANAQVESGFVERSNVDPAIELTKLIETQRQLEANANMIRYQDQMLAKLVNEVGKIG